ncbi:MAG: hypothetical protein ACPLRU_01310 [Desulfofundulus sp.]
MVEMRTLYQCEICGRVYRNREDAGKCEARGRAKVYPVGMLYSGGYKDIVFAVAKNYPEGHSNFFAAWAARDNGYGDNYGTEYCEGGLVLYPPDPKLPAFQRMVDYLTRCGIPVTVWDGEKPVPLEDWLGR